MKAKIIFSIALIALLFTSCQKEAPSVEEDLTAWDGPSELSDEYRTIMDRIAKAEDPKSEIRKINQEFGRYVDDKGDVYFNEEQFMEIESVRNNPNARTTTYYNSWYDPEDDGIGLVTYWDNGSFHWLGVLDNSEVFVTLPTNWDLCGSYNEYFISMALNPSDGSSCTSNCCRDLFGRFYANSNILDQDRWSYELVNPGNPDYFGARIRNAHVSPPFRQSDYVLKLGSCGFDNQCQAGNCPGPVCGWYE